ncbi:MAG: hypothetical protein V4487_08465 [Chlamydiota bacterium]
MAIAVKRADILSSERKYFAGDVADDNEEFDCIRTFNRLERDVTRINSVLIKMKKELDPFRKGEISALTNVDRDDLRSKVEKCEKAFLEFSKKVEEEGHISFYEINERASEGLENRVFRLRKNFETLDKKFSCKTPAELLTLEAEITCKERKDCLKMVSVVAVIGIVAVLRSHL